MAPRTHISAQDIWDKVPCNGFTLENLEDAMGTVPISLEAYVQNDHQSEYQAISRTDDHKRDKTWVFVHLMNRRQRLKMGYSIMDRIERNQPNVRVRTTLDVIKSFFTGSATIEDLRIERRSIEAYLMEHRTQQESLKYKMIDGARQLLNPKGSRRSLMRIMRRLENNHSGATYDQFNKLAIKILKQGG